MVLLCTGLRQWTLEEFIWLDSAQDTFGHLLICGVRFNPSPCYGY